MRTRSTLTALLAVAALTLAGAVPAGARGRPVAVDLVDVTMTGALASTCHDGPGDETGIDGVMVMQRDADGLAPANLGRLALDIPGVDSSRLYPEPVAASGFFGCHGEQLDGTASPYGGLFITLDDTGAVTDLLWHFDYYIETQVRGKRTVMSVMEHFTLSGHNLSWDADRSVVSGNFNVLYHLEDTVQHVSIDYVPRGEVYLEFSLTIAPHV